MCYHDDDSISRPAKTQCLSLFFPVLVFPLVPIGRVREVDGLREEESGARRLASEIENSYNIGLGDSSKEPSVEGSMVTSIELSEQELAELCELTEQSDSTAAIRVAMRDYVRYARRMRLKQLSGQVEMIDNWRALEQAEIDNRHDNLSK